MNRIKVRATITVLGLNAGQQAEIDLTERVLVLVRAGYLRALRPQNVG
jgi:hypothetical protein